MKIKKTMVISLFVIGMFSILESSMIPAQAFSWHSETPKKLQGFWVRGSNC